MSDFWKSKKVLVTGSTGFLGQSLVSKLKKLQPKKIVTVPHEQFDLREYKDCLRVCKRVDLVIHLAANVGGIGYNMQKPAELFDDNLLMGVNMMRAAYLAGVKKFVALGTICSYPKYTPVPFKEENLWDGYPEKTNAPYGLAKKMQLVQAQAYRKQYGFNAIFLLPVNLYGPGDKLNPNQSHVIPALIKKFCDAEKLGLSEVAVWGSGNATREFLYVDDAAEGILLAAEKYNKPDPVNLGSGFEISIKNLAEAIKKLSDYQGKIVWDRTKPDGQPRRKLDISKAKREFGFVAKIPFEEGLKKNINWYQNLDKK